MSVYIVIFKYVAKDHYEDHLCIYIDTIIDYS